MKPLVLIAGAALGLAACGETTVEQSFESEAERACFNRASAELGPGQRLVRNQSGGFVVVTGTGGFVRDSEVSQTFVTCMEGSLGDADGIVAGNAITLTAEEQAIWNGLTDAQKREALIFKQRGGNLRDFQG